MFDICGIFAAQAFTLLFPRRNCIMILCQSCSSADVDGNRSPEKHSGPMNSSHLIENNTTHDIQFGLSVALYTRSIARRSPTDPFNR